MRVIVNEDDGMVTLRDIQEGTEYHFTGNRLGELLEQRVLETAQEDELAAITQKLKNSLPPAEAKLNRETQRRIDYVKGAIDSGMSLGSMRKLSCYISIKSLELVDSTPPSPGTLYRWIKAYTTSASNEESLVPKTQRSGNRNAKTSPENVRIIEATLDRLGKGEKYSTLYRQYLGVLASENERRLRVQEPRLVPVSMEGFRKRIRRRVEQQ
ncbi:hypothetical protein NF212_12305 [Parasalinivibrio latis]|uniref:hypothetical protein n=1 Tax=Parasalinivibrio latis TaxID=2952610 RepID=UPI0030E18126